MNIMEIDSAEGHSEAVRQGAALIEYYVTWCSPCRMQAAITHRVAEDFAGSLAVARVDLERHRQAAEAFGIFSVPTLVVFVDGLECHRFIGLQPRETLTLKLMEILREWTGP